jgi:hypothetical protein
MEWISVKDGLPDVEKKHGHEVLCFWYDIFDNDKRKFKRMDILKYRNGQFWHGYIGNTTKPVTHWMPLPAPPK